MEYFLIKSNDSQNLSEKVTKWINSGWELYGNPFISNSVATNDYGQVIEKEIYIQAIIKKDTE